MRHLGGFVKIKVLEQLQPPQPVYLNNHKGFSMISTLLYLNGIANAVPLQLTQQGRLLDGSGASVTGVHTLTFRVYTDVTGGSVLWSESLSVQFNNGYYATVLGTILEQRLGLRHPTQLSHLLGSSARRHYSYESKTSYQLCPLRPDCWYCRKRRRWFS